MSNPLFEHELQFRVRYQETDAMARVHHSNYLTWFELGRTEMLRAAGKSYSEIEAEGYYLVIAEASCKYHLPAHFDDLLRLRTTVVRARGATLEHKYELFRDDELIVTGRTLLACVDRDGRVRRLPDWLLA